MSDGDPCASTVDADADHSQSCSSSSPDEPPPLDASHGSTHTSPAKPPPSQLHELYEKYNIREKEIERLEKNNEEYREKLVRSLREKHEVEEREAQEKKHATSRIEELERRIVELDCTLKVTRDRANAQEIHFNKTTQALTEKFNKQVNELSKKAEVAENDKNQTVVKYAMREADIMRFQAEVSKKSEEVKAITEELTALKTSTCSEKLEELERTNEDLRVSLEKIKHEKFDLENRFKLEEKKSENAHSMSENLKQQIDVLRRQIISLKEDKNLVQEEHKALLQRVQQEEERLKAKAEEESSEQSGKEELYKKIVHDAARAKEKNSSLSAEIETLLSENTTLMDSMQRIKDKFDEEEAKAKEMAARLKELESIAEQVQSAQEQMRKAVQAKEEAENDRLTAENEAEECRRQTEHMLESTNTLTQKTTLLMAQLEKEKENVVALTLKLEEFDSAAVSSASTSEASECALESLRAAKDAEIESLNGQLKEQIAKVQEALSELNQERNDNAAYRKKMNNTIKELKQEAATLRRQNVVIQQQAVASSNGIELPPPPSTLASSSSRASSITSIDQVSQVSAPSKPRESEKELEREETQSVHSQHSQSASPAVEEVPIAAQQAMIEKIVKLQKQLLRRKEKIEFLEEHVRQCLEELQKKTKLLQYYALREEASLLLPAEDGLGKVPVAKKTASSYALMGAIFTGGSSDKKAALQLSTEVNSRLQAVLEDTLLKNIGLKESLDKLGEEIARLSRENRRLTLTSRTTAEEQ